jgi:hypothetical protein
VYGQGSSDNRGVYDDDPDRNLEDVLAQTAILLHRRGDEQAVALLLDVEEIGLATGNGQIGVDDAWGLSTPVYAKVAVLDVEDHLVARFTPDVCSRIAEVLSYVAERNFFHDVRSVEARPALPLVDDNWRQAIGARLDAERPTNQARRERNEASRPVEDGLTFGSNEERRVYRALTALQRTWPQDDTIAILPLPGAHLREGHTWSPDLLVLGRGRAVIFEVDGPHHRAARRYVDDQNRDLQWKRCGVSVVRLAVEDIANDDMLAGRLTEELKRHLRRD